MRKEIGLYRVPMEGGAKYIHALEVEPGILMHPDVTPWGDGDEGDWDGLCEWTLTHKDTGRYLVTGIRRRGFARKAARILSRLENHECEYHWLHLNPKYMEMVRKMRKMLVWADAWPKEIK